MWPDNIAVVLTAKGMGISIKEMYLSKYVYVPLFTECLIIFDS